MSLDPQWVFLDHRMLCIFWDISHFLILTTNSARLFIFNALQCWRWSQILMFLNLPLCKLSWLFQHRERRKLINLIVTHKGNRLNWITFIKIPFLGFSKIQGCSHILDFPRRGKCISGRCGNWTHLDYFAEFTWVAEWLCGCVCPDSASSNRSLPIFDLGREDVNLGWISYCGIYSYLNI